MCDVENSHEMIAQKTIVFAYAVATHETLKVEVSKLNAFNGKWDIKELDNFLWHMKWYFEVIVLNDNICQNSSYTNLRQSPEREVNGVNVPFYKIKLRIQVAILYNNKTTIICLR